MVNFNNVMVANSDSIYIDVSIKDIYYFENCYINRIIINDIDSYNTQGPNSEKCIYDSGIIDGDNKHFSKIIHKSSFTQTVKNVSNNIYFIYVQTKGVPSMDTPCGQDVEWYKIAIMDYGYIYHKSMAYIRELTDFKCSRPEKFVDFILRIKALEMCLTSGDYEEAITYFKKFFSYDSCDKKATSSNKCGCGCK